MLMAFMLMCEVMAPFLFLLNFLKVTVERIFGGKWGSCSGQACIGIDYLLVEEKFSPTLVLINLNLYPSR